MLLIRKDSKDSCGSFSSPRWSSIIRHLRLQPRLPELWIGRRSSSLPFGGSPRERGTAGKPGWRAGGKPKEPIRSVSGSPGRSICACFCLASLRWSNPRPAPHRFLRSSTGFRRDGSFDVLETLTCVLLWVTSARPQGRPRGQCPRPWRSLRLHRVLPETPRLRVLPAFAALDVTGRRVPDHPGAIGRQFGPAIAGPLVYLAPASEHPPAMKRRLVGLMTTHRLAYLARCQMIGE